MISQEYRIWLALGGKIAGTEIIADMIQQLRETESYKSMPKNQHTEDLLLHATLIILASDQARLFKILHSAKQALTDEEYEKALAIIDKAFKQ